jgi:hypothetical protein
MKIGPKKNMVNLLIDKPAPRTLVVHGVPITVKKDEARRTDKEGVEKLPAYVFGVVKGKFEVRFPKN